MDNGQDSNAARGAGEVLKLFCWSFESVRLWLGGHYICRQMGLENPFLVDGLKFHPNRVCVSFPNPRFTWEQEHAKLVKDIGGNWVPLRRCHTT